MALCLNCGTTQTAGASCRCCCPGSSPEFPQNININTYKTELSLASQPGQIREETLVVSNNIATLEYLPTSKEAVWMYRNGQLITEPECWTLSGKLITFEDGVVFDTNCVMTAKYITFAQVAAVPVADVGTLATPSGTTIPDGWMLCDGRLVSQIDFSVLFAVIGHSYIQAGDVEDTLDTNKQFRIPDLTNTMSDGVQLVEKRMIIKY